MKLTVFGATGATGRLLVEQALSAGHQVTAVVRDPAKMPTQHASLRVKAANVFDADSFIASMAGSDGVVSALGPTGPRDTTKVCSRAMEAIVHAMDAVGTERIVAVSAQPVLRSGTGEPLWYRGSIRPLIRAIYRNVYADLERMETILRESGATWSVLRPPYLTDAEATGHYRRAIEANVVPGSMARADLATAILDAVCDPTTIRHAIGVAGPTRSQK